MHEKVEAREPTSMRLTEASEGEETVRKWQRERNKEGRCLRLLMWLRTGLSLLEQMIQGKTGIQRREMSILSEWEAGERRCVRR